MFTAIVVGTALMALAFIAARAYDLPQTMGKAWGPVDADLQFMDGQTLTTSGDGTTILDLGLNFASYPFRQAVLYLRVSALTLNAGTVSVEVWESPNGTGSWTTTGLYTGVTAVGDILKLVGITKEFVKLTWTITPAVEESGKLKTGGTPPSITADAFLVPAMLQ